MFLVLCVLLLYVTEDIFTTNLCITETGKKLQCLDQVPFESDENTFFDGGI